MQKARWEIQKLRPWAWLALIVNVVVALNGVFVRGTASGAGCGRSWPLCFDALVPAFTSVHTIIEFGHRVLSALALVLVLLLFWRTRQYVPASHPLRRATGLSLILIITEALAGASLVIFDWVVHNLSWGRVFIMPVHLTNTHLLIAALGWVVWLTVRTSDESHLPRGMLGFWLALWGISLLGAMTALNESVTYWEQMGSIPPAFEAPARVVRLALWVHAGLASLLVLTLSGYLIRRGYLRPEGPLWARVVLVAAWVQLGVGALNAWMHMPVLIQMVHLALGYVLWLGWLWLMLDCGQGVSPCPETEAVAFLAKAEG